MDTLLSTSSVFDIGIIITFIGIVIIALNMITFIVFYKSIYNSRFRVISFRILLAGIILAMIGFVICMYGLSVMKYQ